jgi:hypothetical protein
MSILKVDEIQDTAGKKILQNTGSILKISQETGVTTTYINSTSFTEFDFDIDVTPTSSSSKFLIIATNSMQQDDDNNARAEARLQRVVGGTATTLHTSWVNTDATDNAMTASYTITYLDSPATTSTVTYKILARTTKTNSDFRPNSNGSIVAIEISG